MREAHRLAELGLLTAGLIHELRQPVFALKALAQIAERHPESAGDSLGQMLAQIATLESLLLGYGDLSRRPTAAGELFDVRSPVESALVVLRHRAHLANVRLEVELGVGIAVRGSFLAVQQAVVNLGQNAIDAVSGREGASVWITVGRGPSGVWIHVRDDGPGLSSDIREHLFEPFRTTKPTGTGLGLLISRDLLEACGGRLTLRDGGEGAGTAWEIALVAADHG